jgi:hypothetical protein
MRRFGALGGICLETRELHPSVRRLLVVAREQHDEVSRVLDGLVHLLDEVRGKGDVVVLDEDPVALLGEYVRDLARDRGHRAPAAQEEVISLTRTGCHECWCPGSRTEPRPCGHSSIQRDRAAGRRRGRVMETTLAAEADVV